MNPLEPINNPAFELPTVMKDVVAWMAEELEMSLHFKVGYIEEVNQALQKMNATAEGRELKYPLIWLVAPYTGVFGEDWNILGRYKVRILIVTSSAANVSWQERYEKSYQAIHSKIVRKLLEGLNDNLAIQRVYFRAYEETFNAFWGQRQQSVFDDKVDVTELSGIEIIILNNQNC